MRYLKIIALFVLIISYSCEKEMFYDAGPEKSNKVLLKKDFSYVEVEKTFNITLVSDSSDYLIFRAGEKLLQDVSVDSCHDSLFISHHMDGHWYKLNDPVELEIHVSSSPRFYFAAPVKVSTIDTFCSNRLYIDFKSFCELNVTINVSECLVFSPYDGFGNLVLNGKCDRAEFYASGSTFFEAENLQMKSCFVRQKSISDVCISSPNELSVLFISSGNVICNKMPEIIDIERKGSNSTGDIKLGKR